MRNKHAGVCYFCGDVVQPQAEHPEIVPLAERQANPSLKKWRTIHAECVHYRRKLKSGG